MSVGCSRCVTAELRSSVPARLDWTVKLASCLFACLLAGSLVVWLVRRQASPASQPVERTCPERRTQHNSYRASNSTSKHRVHYWQQRKNFVRCRLKHRVEKILFRCVYLLGNLRKSKIRRLDITPITYRYVDSKWVPPPCPGLPLALLCPHVPAASTSLPWGGGGQNGESTEHRRQLITQRQKDTQTRSIGAAAVENTGCVCKNCGVSLIRTCI